MKIIEHTQEYDKIIGLLKECPRGLSIKEISKELEARAKINAEIDAENQALNKVIADNTFAVPSSFVSRQLEFMIEDSKRHLMQKGFKKEDLDGKDGEFREKFKDEAVRKVRLLFILNEIAMQEKIEASDEDLNDAYKTISAQVSYHEVWFE